jgi:hypothetical protein
MADELLDISKFGTLGPNQVVKDDKTRDSIGTDIQVIKRGAINVAEDFSEGFSTAAEMAGDYISVAAGKAYEALPEMDDVLETASSIGSSVKDAVRTAADAIGGPESTVKALMFAAPVANVVLPINAAKFAEFLANDGKIDITSEDLGDDYDFLREKAIETINEGKSSFSYETWGFEEKSILMSDLGETAKKSFTDPNYRMATLIGRTGEGNVRIENGRVIVEDVYDFNTGPRGTKLQQALVLKETGDIEGYERLAEESLGGQTYFGKMRIWAAALGVPQGEGTRFKLDLGPAPE